MKLELLKPRSRMDGAFDWLGKDGGIGTDATAPRILLYA